ncbi:MAG: alpha/beta hydrolase-fold protein [Ignavibacteria bacterium]|nr:alpha/beta hydrolase-fold protein [Ignavibacteria bacterium]
MKIVLTLVLAVMSVSAQQLSKEITVDGYVRKYILHLPRNYQNSVKYSLVMVFHGGGGSAEQIKNYTGFSGLADKENFIVVYPESLDKNWSDGRKGENLPDHDDVKFISMLLDTLIKSYSVDTNRIFSAGMSNGGFFSIYLAYKLSHRILAVAPVTASIPEDYAKDFRTEYPVSLLLINGTKDPLVKYEGGDIGFGENTKRGRSISTDETIKIWSRNNGCQNSVKIEKVDDEDTDDGCTAERYIYYRCNDNSEVVLIKIKGGGHTWPGAKQYLPKIIVGKTCMDFNATETIWEFFKSLPARKANE